MTTPSPNIATSAWIAPTASVVGDVILEENVSVWYGVVIRADLAQIKIGDSTNVQDNAVLHADPGFPLTIGSGVSVGHGAICHGCVIGNDVLVGMGALIMNGVQIGDGALVGAGAVLLEGTIIPPQSLVVGAPSKVIRAVSQEETRRIRDNATTYLHLAERHAKGL